MKQLALWNELFNKGGEGDEGGGGGSCCSCWPSWLGGGKMKVTRVGSPERERPTPVETMLEMEASLDPSGSAGSISPATMQSFEDYLSQTHPQSRGNTGGKRKFSKPRFPMADQPSLRSLSLFAQLQQSQEQSQEQQLGAQPMTSPPQKPALNRSMTCA